MGRYDLQYDKHSSAQIDQRLASAPAITGNLTRWRYLLGTSVSKLGQGQWYAYEAPVSEGCEVKEVSTRS